MRKILIFLSIIVLLNAGETITIAAGAGYKKMTLELLESFDKKDKINSVFGNMRQITTQALNHDISLLIGDKKFFNKINEFKDKKSEKIGSGKLVLIVKKGTNLSNLKDLEKDNIQKISIPDAKKAVYGLAASQAISNLNLNIKDKLLYVATVPQSASYVVSGEVDVGFVNSSEALSIKDKIEQILTVKSELYSEISIVALKLDSCDKSAICKDFVEYLKSKRAKEIILKYGLWAILSKY